MYLPPEALGIELRRPPVLESWNARAHPDQLRLAAFLDDVEAALALPSTGGGLTLALQVGVPYARPLVTGGGDLDNYLFPIVRRLGAARFDAAFATQRHGAASTVAVTKSRPVTPSRGPEMVVRTTASASTRAWKQQVHEACALAAPPTSIRGAFGIDIEFRVSPARNWSSLWKPAIDSLGPLLGVPNPQRPFTPNDDRIVRLGLHRSLDASLGWDVALSVWWNIASG
jgi:hypothetical protein